MIEQSTAMRSHLCAQIDDTVVGTPVTLCGWVSRRREHGEHLAFIDLRDYSGLVQCVVDGAAELRSEYVVSVSGTVQPRPDGTVNDDLASGTVELRDCSVEVLSVAEPPPFLIDDRAAADREVDETIRLRHRYLDLRRGEMQRNLRTRARVNSAIRSAMEEQLFVEVETPMLIASTPEGARDFVVPSRLTPGSFYALPQSPQLFKQLCMVGGVDRYYQIARCLRDEDLRADRQFEFMQLDAEMSFAGQDDVLDAISHAVSAAVAAVRPGATADIRTMTWHDAMERFGSDKPDTRFGLELVELTSVFERTEFNAFRAECVKGLCVPGGADTSRSRLDALTDMVKRWGGKGLVWMRAVEHDGATHLESPVAKFLTADELTQIVERLDASPGDLLFLVADRRVQVRRLLGLLRLELGRQDVDSAGLHFWWVVDFPLFEDIDAEGRPVSAHHPFTMPHVDDLGVLGEVRSGERPVEDLLAVRSQSYDLVLNGWELGSGSVRIHRPDIQQAIFGTLGIDDATARDRFGFLLDAFRFGAPPHAGFAFGIDRLVALLLDEENIREVIAFPKTQSGGDPLTRAPSPLDSEHLRELGLIISPLVSDPTG